MCLICLPLIFLLTAAKTPGSPPRIVAVDKSKQNSSLDLHVGDQLEINLPGNPTTGYQWLLQTIDKTILKPLGEPEYKSAGDAIGAGGHFTFRLQALARGETGVEMVYRQPFDLARLPPEDVYHIMVKVA